jgi:hypothetical protein
MLSSPAPSLPEGEGWQFEPKWDGFRTLVFRDGDEILLQSRDEKPMNRYFRSCSSRSPRASRALRVDGEIVIVGARVSTSRRCCCASTRGVAREAAGSQIAGLVRRWDLLALDDRICGTRRWPSAARDSSRPSMASRPRCISPRSRAIARWPRTGSSASKAPDSTGSWPSARRAVPPGERTMIKVKHKRTADCVVAGFRWHKNGRARGRVAAARLFDEKGTLHHVGVTAAFTNAVREQLVEGAGAASRARARGPSVARLGRGAERSQRRDSVCPAPPAAGIAART